MIFLDCSEGHNIVKGSQAFIVKFCFEKFYMRF